MVEIRDGSPPDWPLLWARVEECTRCAVPDGGLRRISDRNELAGAAVEGGEARTRITGGRILRWLASWLALAGPYVRPV
jgi:hypothetical protein